MPLFYEINTRVWVRELSEKYQREIDLGTIPEEEILHLKKIGFDVVWLMGIWRSSNKGQEVALNHVGLRREFMDALPDVKPGDIICSPYSITGYDPDPSLGGKEGILDFKKRLNKNGMKLLLDFIPNHVAIDHPWVKSNPEFFIHGTAEDVRDNPDLFFSAGNKIILAHGKDPYFPAWPDVAQLNYFNPETKEAMYKELLKVSSLCDGVRCDMAMLILKKIQLEIWGERVFAGTKFTESEDEFWQEAIAGVKQRYSEFIFIAEVYWELEPRLIAFGFDYVYDKPFYDALRDSDMEKIRQAFLKQEGLSDRKLKFIENHDENRAAAVFGMKRLKAAALLLALAPGSHLFHQGQLEGFRIKVPVYLLRKPMEDKNQEIYSFYENLIQNIKAINKNKPSWVLLKPAPAWDANPTHRNFIGLFNQNNYLAVINYSDVQSQCYFYLGRLAKGVKHIIFKDLLSPAGYKRPVDDIILRGLYLDLAPYELHLFEMSTE